MVKANSQAVVGLPRLKYPVPAQKPAVKSINKEASVVYPNLVHSRQTAGQANGQPVVGLPGAKHPVPAQKPAVKSINKEASVVYPNLPRSNNNVPSTNMGLSNVPAESSAVPMDGKKWRDAKDTGSRAGARMFRAGTEDDYAILLPQVVM